MWKITDAIDKKLPHLSLGILILLILALGLSESWLARVLILMLLILAGTIFFWRQWEHLGSTTLAFYHIVLAVAASGGIYQGLVVAHKNLWDERYQDGVHRLGGDAIPARMGSIHLLEQVAKEYPEEYHENVIKVLSAFIRTPASSKEQETNWNCKASRTEGGVLTCGKTTCQDVQEALTVIVELAREDENEINLRNACLAEADIEDAKLNNINLSNAYLKDANIRNTTLTSAILTDADMTSADLIGADLVNANLINANLVNVNLINAKLYRAKLYSAKLTKANLINANLIGANLINANLIGAKLTSADMIDTDLVGADLVEANLASAILTDANLTSADMTRAILTDADLKGAVLTGANLTEVQGLTQAQLNTAIIREGGTPPRLDGAKDNKTKKQLVWSGKTVPSDDAE